MGHGVGVGKGGVGGVLQLSLEPSPILTSTPTTTTTRAITLHVQQHSSLLVEAQNARLSPGQTIALLVHALQVCK